ncbi:MAG: hypothetical protein JWR07_4766, partial [Nevskia sp.]|nr:hypothetical protein [Nevskia sp.]
MNSRQWLALAAGTACLALSSAAYATATAAEAARLGKDLTAVGATAAGNSDGTIPAWVGGKNFDDSIKTQTPQSLEILRQQFEIVRTKSPGDFDALLKYLDSFTLADY